MAIDENDCRVERLPGEHDSNFPWSIIRTPASGKLKLISVSADLFGIRTHYWAGRTGPCLKTGCQACDRKVLSRWTGYLLTVEAKSERRFAFEFPGGAALQLDEQFRAMGSLRGLMIVAGRTAERANAKVYLEFKGTSPQAARLPAAEPVWPILSHIWGLAREAEAQFGGMQENVLSEHDVSMSGGGVVSRARDLNGAGKVIAKDLVGQLKFLDDSQFYE